MVSPDGWQFTGTTRSRRRISGYVTDTCEAAARANLAHAGITLERLQTRRVWRIRRQRPPRRTDFAALAEQLADQIEAGVPILEACDVLSRSNSNRLLGKALVQAREQIRQGQDLSAAFAAVRNQRGDPLFPQTFLNALGAGEAAGETVTVLKGFAAAQLKADSTLSRIRGALIYPGLVISLAMIIALAFLYFVMPTMSDFYREVTPPGQDATLPLLTRMMIAGSTFLLSWAGVLFALVVLATLVLAGRWLLTRSGRLWLARRSIRWPVVGGLLRQHHAAVSLRNVALLVRSGSALDQWLHEAGKAATNPVYAEMFSDVREFLAAQSTDLATAFAPYTYLMGEEFHSLLVTQENTASMELLCTKYAEVLETRVDRALERTSKLLEPVLIVGVAIFIGLFVIGIYSPLFEAIGKLARTH
jgi:type IV pilus assembly protein PilC